MWDEFTNYYNNAYTFKLTLSKMNYFSIFFLPKTNFVLNLHPHLRDWPMV